MTLIVGIKCHDGVVIGSDGAVTHSPAFGATTITQVAVKLKLIGTDFIIGVSGPVSLSQSFAEEIEPVLKSTQNRCNFRDIKAAKSAIHGKMFPVVQSLWQKSEMVAKTLGPQAAANEVLSDTLLAFPCNDEAHLFNFDHKGSMTETDKNLTFVSVGSGKPTVDPFLAFLRRTFWKNGLPSVTEGLFAAAWALKFSIDAQPGGIGPPIQLMALRKGSGQGWLAEQLDEQQLYETNEMIEAVQDAMVQSAKMPPRTGPSTPMPPELT